MATHLFWLDTTWSTPHPGAEVAAHVAHVFRVGTDSTSAPYSGITYRSGVRGRHVAGALGACAMACAINEHGSLMGVRSFTMKRDGSWTSAFSFVGPRFRRQGVATSLLDFAMSDLPVRHLSGWFTPSGLAAARRVGPPRGLTPDGMTHTIAKPLRWVNDDFTEGAPIGQKDAARFVRMQAQVAPSMAHLGDVEPQSIVVDPEAASAVLARLEKRAPMLGLPLNSPERLRALSVVSDALWGADSKAASDLRRHAVVLSTRKHIHALGQPV